MKSFKKVFSSFVSLTTILWSVGGMLAFPNVASAATLNTGDLIKASGPAVYYYAADGKRYVFPNEKTYFSWYNDFSSVKTITDAELAAILIGGNVTIRPGTKLVKITTDPKVYAVTGTCGTLHWIESEAVAKALYGDNWAQRVVDVPDGFFVNYTVGSSIPTATHPDGTLVTYTGDSNTYLVQGGMKRLVTSAGMTANKLDAADAIPTTISYGSGADVTGYEAGIGDVACTTGSTSAVNGSVSVSLASDTPAGVTEPQGAAHVNMLKVTLTAGAEAAQVTALTFHRVGVGSSSDFANVYVYDANGTRLTTGHTVNSTANTVTFNNVNISVPANGSTSVVLVGDYNTSLTAGSQSAFELADAASVGISGSGTVSGSFPVRGNTFTVGSTTASRLDVKVGTAPSNPNIGSTDAEIANFKLVANTNDIEVRSVTLLESGTANSSDLTNLTLYQGSTVVATTAATAGDKVVLTFSPPFVVANGQTKTFSLHAKIAGKSALTIRSYVEYTTDVYAIDTRYGTGAQVDIATNGTYDGTGFTAGTTGCDTPGNSSCVVTQGGTLTVAFNGPPTGNIAKASQDAVLYKFSLTSSDNDLDIRKLRFRLDSTDGGAIQNGTTDYFTDIKVKDLDSGATVMGPTSLGTSVASGTSFLLTDSFTLHAGETRNLAITADLANSTATDFASHKYRACLSDDTSTKAAAGTDVTTYCASSDKIFQLGDVKLIDTGENLALAKIVPNAAITGNALTVQTSSLSVTLAGSPSAGTAVKKQANIPAVGFVFTAGSESDVTVRAVKLTGTGDATTNNTYTVADLSAVVTSCALFDGTTQVGTAQSPDTTLGTMNFTNLSVSIPKGSSKTLVAKCTADSVVAGSFDHFALGIATASTDVTADDQDNNSISSPTLSAGVTSNAATTGQTLIQTVNNSGSLTVTQGSQPAATIAVAGNAVKFAEFKATAQYEDVTIDRVTVSSTGWAANLSGVSVRVAGSDVGSDILSTGFGQRKDVTLTTPVTVPKDGSATLELWGTLANTVSSSTVSGSLNAPRSGNAVGLGLAAGVTASPWDSNWSSSFNVNAIGAASGERLYASGSTTLGNSMVLRKTKPTVTKLAVSTNSLTSGSSMELYKFQITPDAAGSVAWKQITFTVTTSSASIALSNFQLYKGSTQLTANTQVRILDGTAGSDITGSTALGTGNTVIVYLINEEVVTGSGTVYTLRATPSYSGSSATVSTSITRSTADATGYLYSATTTKGFSIQTDTTPDQTGATATTVTSPFIWSDNSEVPHSYATGSTASRDWSNDFYVQDMTQSQTLTQ